MDNAKTSAPKPARDDLATRVEAYHALRIDIAALRNEVAELEAEREQLWKAAKTLRGAVRIALDEWLQQPRRADQPPCSNVGCRLEYAHSGPCWEFVL